MTDSTPSFAFQVLAMVLGVVVLAVGLVGFFVLDMLATLLVSWLLTVVMDGWAFAVAQVLPWLHAHLPLTGR